MIRNQTENNRKSTLGYAVRVLKGRPSNISKGSLADCFPSTKSCKFDKICSLIKHPWPVFVLYVQAKHSGFSQGPFIVQLERLSKALQVPVTLRAYKHNELPEAHIQSHGIGHEPPPFLSTENTADTVAAVIISLLFSLSSPRKRFHCPKGVFPIVWHSQFPEQLTELSVECIQGNSKEFQCKIV